MIALAPVGLVINGPAGRCYLKTLVLEFRNRQVTLQVKGTPINRYFARTPPRIRLVTANRALIFAKWTFNRGRVSDFFCVRYSDPF